MFRSGPVALVLLLAQAASVQAQSDLYRCTDAAGHATFTDEGGRRDMLRTKRADSCERLSGLPVASVPATRNSPRNAAAEAPRTQVSPASFPRVEADTQRLRDTDRRRILEEELRSEEDKLARLRGEEKAGGLSSDRVQRLRDDIGRSENNLAALKRELSFLRQ
jgi:hypothetical protein